MFKHVKHYLLHLMSTILTELATLSETVAPWDQGGASNARPASPLYS